MLMPDVDTLDKLAERQSVMLRRTQRLRQDVATQAKLAESFAALQRLLPKLLLRLTPSQRHDVVILDRHVARPSVMRMLFPTLPTLRFLNSKSTSTRSSSLRCYSHSIIAHFTSIPSILLSTHLLLDGGHFMAVCCTPVPKFYCFRLFVSSLNLAMGNGQ
jgi:hypothetical protein